MTVLSYVISITKLDVKKKVGPSRELWAMRDIDPCYESTHSLGHNVCRSTMSTGPPLHYALSIYEVR